jgi:hypothetical protein
MGFCGASIIASPAFGNSRLTGIPFCSPCPSRNRALADVVAAREFGKRRDLRPSSAGLGLLRRGQFRRSAHVLPALLRTAAALGGAGAD